MNILTLPCIIDMKLLHLEQLGTTTNGLYNRMEIMLTQVNIGKSSLATMMRLRMLMELLLQHWFLDARQIDLLQKQNKIMMHHTVYVCQDGCSILAFGLMKQELVIVEWEPLKMLSKL